MTIDSQGYRCMIENGILDRAGQLLASSRPACKALIVTDSNVAPVYLSRLESSLSTSGYDVSEYIVSPGEKSKELGEIGRMIDHAAASGLTRSDIMIALGGGVVGDMTGFAASVYMRGIGYANVPTTLLAMVDSSIGGKTGVDRPLGKNLAGSFWMPFMVISDPDVLSTLPDGEFSYGMAETIKTAVIGSRDLFDDIAALDGRKTGLAGIIEKAAAFKIAVTGRDPRESGERMILNFGHTVGHALEVLSDYSLPHGMAVASGMHVMAAASEAMGLCPDGTASALDALLVRAGLDPFIHRNYDITSITGAIAHDKKKRGEKYFITVLEDIGKAKTICAGEDRLYEIIKAGM